MRKNFSLLLILGVISDLTIIQNLYAVVWPNTPNGGRSYPQGLSSDFGPRILSGTFDFHEGLDFPDDSSVKVVESGTIKYIIPEGENALIGIDGEHLVEYIHIGDILVGENEYVLEGTVIGKFLATKKHVHIELETPHHTNPLRDLFSPLYTSSKPEIKSITLTGRTFESHGVNWVNGAVKVDAYIETMTKDLDVVEFTLSPNPSGSGFPTKFDYHNWQLLSGMSVDSYTDKFSPAEDHFYFEFDTTNWPAGIYVLNAKATDVNGNSDEKKKIMIVGGFLVTSGIEYTDPNIQTLTQETVDYANPNWTPPHGQYFDGKRISLGSTPNFVCPEMWGNLEFTNGFISMNVWNYPNITENTVIDFNPAFISAGGGGHLVDSELTEDINGAQTFAHFDLTAISTTVVTDIPLNLPDGTQAWVLWMYPEYPADEGCFRFYYYDKEEYNVIFPEEGSPYYVPNPDYHPEEGLIDIPAFNPWNEVTAAGYDQSDVALWVLNISLHTVALMGVGPATWLELGIDGFVLNKEISPTLRQDFWDFPSGNTSRRRPLIRGSALSTGGNITGVFGRYASQTPSTWTLATPVDGAFDGASEEFIFTPPEDFEDGEHFIEIKAVNEQGDIDAVYSKFYFTVSVSSSAVMEKIKTYVWPNPARGENPTIKIDCNVSDANVRLKIYTIAGELVFEKDISNYYNDGNGAYEFEWNTMGKASGVYVYLVETKKDDKCLKKTGKFAVVK